MRWCGCDTAETLNDKCNPGKQEHKLIERTIMAMPDDIVEKIEIKTEHAGAHSDYHAAQAEWAGVIERHTERETRRASGRAMAAAGNDQGALIKLQQQIELLTAQMAQQQSAHAAQRYSKPSAGHPYHATCGGKHPGGDDECWMLNLDKVPKSMASMLAGLHRKRAAKGLPDMSAKYPAPASGHMVTVVERASAVVQAVGRGEMLVDSQASVDLSFDAEMFQAGSLVPCVGKSVQVASGALLAATHTGTLDLIVEGKDNKWHTVQRKGAWLVPGLTVNLLSVRAGKELGFKSPDFDGMVVYGPNGEQWPMIDRAPDYVLRTRIPWASSHAMSTVARGRAQIPTSRLNPAEAAKVISSVFGHAGSKTIEGVLEATTGLNENAKEKIMKGLAQGPDRSIPNLANMQAKPSPAVHMKDEEETGYVLTDLAGPFPKVKVGPYKGACYYQLCVDTATDFTAIYFLSNKKAESTVAAVKKFTAECRALNSRYAIRVLRSDRGGEFNNGMMQDYLASQSVQVSLGAPYHPDHTRCEPHNHTIKRFMRSGLLESGLDHELWAYFAKQAVECRNMYSRKDGKSAVELMSGGRVVPKINHLRPIGCRAICKKTNVELIAEGSSLAPRGHEGINLGTERDSPGYLVWVPSLGKVKVT